MIPPYLPRTLTRPACVAYSPLPWHTERCWYCGSSRPLTVPSCHILDISVEGGCPHQLLTWCPANGCAWSATSAPSVLRPILGIPTPGMSWVPQPIGMKHDMFEVLKRGEGVLPLCTKIGTVLYLEVRCHKYRCQVHHRLSELDLLFLEGPLGHPFPCEGFLMAWNFYQIIPTISPTLVLIPTWSNRPVWESNLPYSHAVCIEASKTSSA